MRSRLPVLIALAGCCPPAHPLSATAHDGGCGEVNLEISTPRGMARTLTLESGAMSTEVPVGLGQGHVRATLPAALDGPISIRDGRQLLEVPAHEPHPPVLGLTPPDRVSAGEPSRFEVSITAPPACRFDEWRIALTAHPEDGGAASRSEVKASGTTAIITLDGLAPGPHRWGLQWVHPLGYPGAILEGDLLVGPPCVDADRDGVMACDGDCNDADPEIRPGVPDIEGDHIDNDCDGVNGLDRDGDGYESEAVGGADCDDRQPLVHPGQRALDRDGDGYFGVPEDVLDVDCDDRPDVAWGRGGDCDDDRPAVHPGAEEPSHINQLDDDCDGKTDEGTPAWDDDGDGFTEQQGDCDDADTRRLPGGAERWDCVDNDCDQAVDEGLTSPGVDDPWEPNDLEPAQLSRARKGFLGWSGTRDEVQLVSRNAGDIEQYTIYAHDGLLDSFGVHVTLLERGSGTSYETTVVRPSGEREEALLMDPGDALHLRGIVDSSDSGDYTIILRPRGERIEYCPAKVRIVSQ